MSKQPELEKIDTVMDAKINSEDVRTRIIDVVATSAEIDERNDERIDRKLDDFKKDLKVETLTKEVNLKQWLLTGAAVLGSVGSIVGWIAFFVSRT
ncbi:MAG: hypothetical protein OYG31_00445 [Candidatus Kaiserbacteria bacterium]|nr:hypothetical protein [Candidatus Kaiserbacteria bacterium]